jgi:hypothetical protein
MYQRLKGRVVVIAFGRRIRIVRDAQLRLRARMRRSSVLAAIEATCAGSARCQISAVPDETKETPSPSSG